MDPLNKKDTVFFNGRMVRLAKVRISPLDRGFLCGDSVYEVIPTYGGKLFTGKEHIDRLLRSMRETGIETPLSAADWLDVCERLVKANASYKEQVIYLHVTRGALPKRQLGFPVHCAPTLLGMSLPFKAAIHDDYPGGSAITIPDERWARCDIKSTDLLPNILAYRAVRSDSVTDAILIRKGYAVEGPSSNLFLVEGQRAVTPPADNILAGITRGILLRLLAETELEPVEEPIEQSRLYGADEVWLTNSIEEIKPIVSIDGQRIAEGRPGRWWLRLRHAFERLKRAD